MRWFKGELCICYSVWSWTWPMYFLCNYNEQVSRIKLVAYRTQMYVAKQSGFATSLLILGQLNTKKIVISVTQRAQQVTNIFILLHFFELNNNDKNELNKQQLKMPNKSQHLLIAVLEF